MRERTISRVVRNFLFSKANREFLIFLFFLLLSGTFWLLTTLNETYEQELKVPVRIVNIPQNVVLTSDEVDTVRVTVRDKGITLLGYYTQGVKTVNVNFRNYATDQGTGTVPVSELMKLIARQLSATSLVSSYKPDKLRFFYNNGSKKRVPVRWSGRVTPEHLYYISDVHYEPDSVTIYAPEDKLDSITVAYTEALSYANFRDTLSVDCRLRRAEGVKTVPDRVQVTFITDVLTEESIDGVPVRGINLPKGKRLRTFPGKVRVRFVTGASTFRNLKPTDFLVVADYNELRENPSEKCTLYLRKTPAGVSRASLETAQVDYLIEEDDTEQSTP